MSMKWTEQRLRKALKQMANNHESAAVEVMRAVERANDPKLAQRLLEVIEQMHQDADALRSIDDEIASGVIRCQ
ncbi:MULTISPECIES: hypothetical protein [Pseudomonas]|jgi:phage shock protein A|uniref:Uncharacterized protein n=6 Tax=Pseudomonas TaxID=286 RepID=A0A071L5C5_PSEAI|nr:hypothetical protein [Pseudomonas aeruginosa]YP_008719747.1 hypothetical protein PA1797a [Pseudomonas aeruginosa PAO1]ABJ10981.1 hypothetical protein PA14_41300 [Pseudomonas aeruginosa UCBPP-PA14]AEO75732.1 hypothetical protein PAM18_3249 [Pseudomonas aeruginosa M18]AGO43293.1 hypothetical protein M062_09390 [Pseudomonas aeruginosa RP73]AGV57850.1 hypothetical protein M801_1848 [Pseudomonas aeruginosa PAO581]AGV64107.1 hypothetical protein M802_1846 [Pseudomonas aeruginosa c7447m]AGY63267